MEPKCRCLYRLLNLDANERDKGWKNFIGSLIRNYRKIMLSIHPDRNMDPIDTGLASKLVNLARETLSDKTNEQVYSEFGQLALKDKHNCHEALRVINYIEKTLPSSYAGNENTPNASRAECDRFDVRKERLSSAQTPMSSSSSVYSARPLARNFGPMSRGCVTNNSNNHDDENQAGPTVGHRPVLVSMPLAARGDKEPIEIQAHYKDKGRAMRYMIRWRCLKDTKSHFSGEDYAFITGYPGLIERYMSHLHLHHPRMIHWLLKNQPELRNWDPSARRS